jgi:hypothetical protein
MVRNVRGLRCVPRVVAACCCFAAVHYFCQPRTTMKLKIENGLVGKIAGAVLALSLMFFRGPIRFKPTKTTSLATPVCLGLSN